MFHIAAGAALGRTALPQPLHPLTLAVLGDWPEPTLVVAAAALSSPSLCPSPPSSPLRVLPDCSTLYALMSHLSFDGTRSPFVRLATRTAALVVGEVLRHVRQFIWAVETAQD